MGRPLNKKYFGPDAGGDGFQLIGSAWFDGEVAAEACFVVKQKATSRFLIEGSTSGKQQIMDLKDGAPAAEGDFQIAVNGTESAKKISGHKVVTFAGDVFVWDDVVNAADSVDDVVDADLGDDAD